MSTMVAVSLTSSEVELLGEAEAVIERGLKTFLEVGEALASIRDNRLYRADFDTFEDYAESRWGFSKTHANRLVAASEVAAILTPMGVEINNERQARELAPLVAEPEKLRAAFAEVAERTNGKPTAAALREVVREQLAPDSEVAQMAHAELDRAEQRQAEVAEHNAWAAGGERDTQQSTRDYIRNVGPIFAIELALHELLDSVAGVNPEVAIAQAHDLANQKLRKVGDAIAFLRRVEQAMGATA